MSRGHEKARRIGSIGVHGDTSEMARADYSYKLYELKRIDRGH